MGAARDHPCAGGAGVKHRGRPSLRSAVSDRRPGGGRTARQGAAVSVQDRRPAAASNAGHMSMMRRATVGGELPLDRRSAAAWGRGGWPVPGAKAILREIHGIAATCFYFDPLTVRRRVTRVWRCHLPTRAQRGAGRRGRTQKGNGARPGAIGMAALKLWEQSREPGRLPRRFCMTKVGCRSDQRPTKYNGARGRDRWCR